MEKHKFEESFNAIAPLKIDEIQVLWLDDSDVPSFLGDYSNEPKEGAIDREERGERTGHEYRYFNPANPEAAMYLYLRYEAFCRGEWSLQGCVARALVSYPVGEGSRRLEVLSSSGLYGIDSDEGEKYRLEIAIEQIEQLKNHVKVFGVPWSDDAETLLLETRNRLVAQQEHEEAQRQVARPAQQD